MQQQSQQIHNLKTRIGREFYTWIDSSIACFKNGTRPFMIDTPFKTTSTAPLWTGMIQIFVVSTDVGDDDIYQYGYIDSSKQLHFSNSSDTARTPLCQSDDGKNKEKQTAENGRSVAVSVVVPVVVLLVTVAVAAVVIFKFRQRGTHIGKCLLIFGKQSSVEENSVALRACADSNSTTKSSKEYGVPNITGDAVDTATDPYAIIKDTHLSTYSTLGVQEGVSTEHVNVAYDCTSDDTYNKTGDNPQKQLKSDTGNVYNTANFALDESVDEYDHIGGDIKRTRDVGVYDRAKLPDGEIAQLSRET